MAKALQRLSEFIALESAGGFVLLAGAVLAMALVNSPLDGLYPWIRDYELGISFGTWQAVYPLHFWVNEALMTLFFLLVGMEIKRELLEGHLQDRRQALLPVIAALGGVIAPALIYFAVSQPNSTLTQGWAIPVATDIAFSLAVLRLLGNRVPLGLKIFLTAVAVVDDLLAILIIALFYSDGINHIALGTAVILVNLLCMLNYYRVTRAAPYLIIGIGLWVAVLVSGIHPTVAGVALALTIPLKSASPAHASLLRSLEESLHPWVVFGVLPVFAFFNTGISLEGLTPASLVEPLPLAVLLGLFVGKPLGIFGSVWCMVRFGLAQKPEGCGWRHIGAIGVLAGIGFTMSLFIGALAFDDAVLQEQVRLGVIAASLLSASAGYLLLRYALHRKGAL